MNDVAYCDFCNTTNPHKQKVYGCESFSIGIVNAEGTKSVLQNSIGDWMACETCAKLVDAEDWEAILVRALDKYKPYERVALSDFIREYHRQFQMHRTNKPKGGV
jgi:hypothetical protein